MKAFTLYPHNGGDCGWQTLADVCGILDDVPLSLKEGTEELRKTKVEYTEGEQLQQLLSGQICMINFSGANFVLRISLQICSLCIPSVVLLSAPF